jgi:hypothetical protein
MTMIGIDEKKEAIHGLLRSLAAVLWIASLVAGCEKPSMNNGSVSMTKDDLEEAYHARDPSLAGHQSAQGVVAGPEGITVLATANPAGDAEHTWLLRLDLDGAVTWQRHYEPKYGAARAIAHLAGGGFAIAGEVQRGPTAYQATLVTTNANGEVVAAKALGPRGITGFSAVQVRVDGSLFAGGSAPKGWLVAIDPALRSPTEHMLPLEDVKALGVQSTENVAVLGVAERSTTGFGRGKITSLGASSESLWERELPTTGHGDPAALVIQPEGALAVGSGAADEHELAHVWLAFVDNAGAVRWERTITAGAENARGWAAVGLADGYAIVGETATIGGIRTPHVWRLGKDGAPRWDQRYRETDGEQAFEIVNAIAGAQDGGLILAGSTTHGAGKTNVWIVRLTPDGKIVWRRTLGSAATG